MVQESKSVSHHTIEQCFSKFLSPSSVFLSTKGSPQHVCYSVTLYDLERRYDRIRALSLQ